MEVPKEYIPRCPRCNGPMFLCVRGGNWFIESAFEEQRKRYRDFIQEAVNKQDSIFTIIEVGVGFNTPVVIRWPMDKLVTQYKNVRLIRINMHASDVPARPRAEKRAIGFDGDAATVIRNLKDILKASNT